jgi:hypothetical protein
MAESISQRVAILEIQMKRLVADAESEKATRARANAELDHRLRSLEQTVVKIVALGVGALGVLQIILASLKYLN